MTTDVFISYKREERGDVERIAERLRGLGLNVWFDTKLSSGMSFDEEINREVRGAKCVLVCWSPGAMASDWVRAEASIGRGREVLAAVLLRATDLYPPFNLIHAEDLTSWQGEDLHPGWLNTLARIGTLCDRPDIVDRARRYVAASAGPAPAAAPTVAREPGAPPPQPPKAKGPGPAVWIALGLLALALIGGGGLWASGLLRPGGGTPLAAACPARVDPGSNGLFPRLEALRRDYDNARGSSDECVPQIESDLAAVEKDFWAQAQNEKTPAIVKEFLKLFPADASPAPQYRKDAEALLAQLEAAAPGSFVTPNGALPGQAAERIQVQALNPERIAHFEQEWGRIDRNNPYNLRVMIAAFPNFPRADDVRKQYRALDDAAWAKAKSANQANAYLAYLSDYGPQHAPPGAYVDQAQAALKALSSGAPPAGGETADRRRTGVSVVPPMSWIDLDTVPPAKSTADDFPGKDLLFITRSGTQRFLGPPPGQQNTALVEGEQPDLATCQRAAYTGAELNVMRAGGQWLCVKTSEGRFAAVRVMAPPDRSPAPLRMGFTVFRGD